MPEPRLPDPLEGFPNPPEELERRIGLFFRDRLLLAASLTHPSYLGETLLPDNLRVGATYERLEFLGDAVVGLAVCRRLYERNDAWDQGRLSKLKARIVSKPILSKVAQRLDMDRYIRKGKGIQGSPKRYKTGLLCDCFEALVGAICLEHGYQTAETFVLRELQPEIEELLVSGYNEDFKTAFQEAVQKRFKTLPQYRLISESGPEHEKNFFVKTYVLGKEFGEGSGGTKKEAENQAAQNGLGRFKNLRQARLRSVSD